MKKTSSKKEEGFVMPEWQKEIVLKRIEEYERSPKSGKSLDAVIKAISKKHDYK